VLGEKNFALLSKSGVRTSEGIDVTPVVAAAIVAVQGMIDTAKAMAAEMDARGMAHLTASMTVNRAGMDDTTLYLARASVLSGEIATQGFGIDAEHFGGEMFAIGAERRLRLSYGVQKGSSFPVERGSYAVRTATVESDPYA
jgi:hypothetical protein